MALLLNLVEDVIFDILSNWTKAASLAKLDSACCNQLERNQFLKLLKSKHVTIECELLCDRNDKLNWIILRQLKLRSFMAKLHLIFLKQEIVHKLDVSCIKEAQISRFGHKRELEEQMAWFVDWINRCYLMEKLVLVVRNHSAFIFQFVSQIDFGILEKLKVFSCDSFGIDNRMSVDLLAHLEARCVMLTHIRLNSVPENTVPVLAQLIRNNASSLSSVTILFKDFA